MKKLIILLMSLPLFYACKSTEEKADGTLVSGISESVYGLMPDSTEAKIFTLKNAQGMEVTITNYGGKIVTWTAPDRDGKYENINLGMKKLEDYFDGAAFFGTLVGRYGNRIGNAKFTLDGTEYKLIANNGPNSLHGGGQGFDKVLWNAEVVEAENPTLKLSHLSPDGDSGYPGNVNVEVTYTLLPDNALQIDYKATTDKPTVLALTNHAYFNLTGMKEDILGHEVTIAADTYLPVDAGLIPLGAPEKVAGTPFDFTSPHVIGERINDTTNTQIKVGKGYDHAWVFTDKSTGLKQVASVYEPKSGRVLEVSTTEPAVQFYSGNFLDGKLVGHNDVAYKQRWGFCLETEKFPDSPNKPDYPSSVLRPGETLKSTTIYKFSVKK